MHLKRTWPLRLAAFFAVLLLCAQTLGAAHLHADSAEPACVICSVSTDDAIAPPTLSPPPPLTLIEPVRMTPESNAPARIRLSPPSRGPPAP